MSPSPSARATRICLTVDICENFYDSNKRWEYLEEISRIRERFEREVRSRFDSQICFTWFVRADDSIRREFGSTTALMERPEWSVFQEKGDEIAWHAHFYQAVRDIQRTDEASILEETQACLRQVIERYPVTSARMGRFYSSEKLLSLLWKMGITVDSSCLPGRESSREDLVFDWKGSPLQSFLPGKEDYRREGDPIGIVELPFSTLPIQFSYDPESYRRYLNIGFETSAFQNALKKAKQESLLPTEIVLLIHPFELLPSQKSHDAISFDLEGAISNLACLLEGLSFEFVTAQAFGRRR